MKKLFGTDGIRGKANIHPMSPEMAVQLGRAMVRVLRDKSEDSGTYVIARDTRVSGDMLESALASGISAQGGEAMLCGVLPTGGLAFLCRQPGVRAGAMVSASHNPYGDNGIKLFDHQGFKLPDATEKIIEDQILGNSPDSDGPGADPGPIQRDKGAGREYLSYLQNKVSPGLNLDGVRLVLDCANGAAFEAAPRLFAGLGAKVRVLADRPDGKNINLDCGSQHPEKLAKTVVLEGAHLGLAFDGDADRLIAVDETGAVLTGDRLMAVFAGYLMEKNQLPGNRVVFTVMSNLGLKIALEKMGIQNEITPVGDKYVLDRMRKTGAVLGGEDSGHIIFLDLHTTGDGLLAGVKLLEVMTQKGRPLSQLAGIMTAYPQILVNTWVNSKPDLSEIPGLFSEIQKLKNQLGDKGRVLVRYSGTQNLCRVMVEGPSRREVEAFARHLSGIIEKNIGAA